jgi:hypothetical protein
MSGHTSVSFENSIYIVNRIPKEQGKGIIKKTTESNHEENTHSMGVKCEFV